MKNLLPSFPRSLLFYHLFRSCGFSRGGALAMRCACFHHPQHKLPHLHCNRPETERMPARHLANKRPAPDYHTVHKPPIPHSEPSFTPLHAKEGQDPNSAAVFRSPALRSLPKPPIWNAGSPHSATGRLQDSSSLSSLSARRSCAGGLRM